LLARNTHEIKIAVEVIITCHQILGLATESRFENIVVIGVTAQP
jgi:hypothetical protein